MRRFICLLLAVLMVLSVTSCGGDIDTEVIDTTSGENTDASKNENVKVPAEKYDGVFKVGYDRQDVTPNGVIYLKGGVVQLTSVLDPIFATCIAINDGETTALLYTVDVCNIAAEHCEVIRSRVSRATDVPEDNIVVSATHNHSAPQPGIVGNRAVNLRWTEDFYNSVIIAAKNAIADLDDAEIHIGSTRAEGMAFTNRWILSDGTPSSIWRLNYEYERRTDAVAYESEADDLVQLIRFVRENKKDILLANWGIHFTSAMNLYPNAISSDLNYYLRTVVESGDEDLLFAFYLGACGNTSAHTYVEGTKKYPNYGKMGVALANFMLEAMDSLTRVEAGKINAFMTEYDAKVRKDSAERVGAANEVMEKTASLTVDSDEYYAVLEEYGFESKYDVQNVLSRNAATRGEFDTIRLTSLSFGDIGLVGVPYEMFDTNGMQIRDASPFEMTLVLTACGGSSGYVPSALAVRNGGYQVYRSPFEFGTAEEVASELLCMLRQHKGIK